MPHRVGRQDKVPDREGSEVREHPDGVDGLAGRDENQDGRQTENGRKQEERDGVAEALRGSDNRVDDEGESEANGDGEGDGSDEIHEHDELHAAGDRKESGSETPLAEKL